jgi:Ni/Fe-hydrogenase subunit HybB-like protein
MPTLERDESLTSAEDLEAERKLLDDEQQLESVNEKISSIAFERRTRPLWWAGFAMSFLLVMLLFYAVAYLFIKGVGIWGVNIPVAWGFAIVNFVWWIGIGHAGTLISAVLLLLHQQWRTSINRFAEAMTLFAVACAALFPLLHLGRPWLFYYLFPYPDTMRMWPQFRSPLVWDVFAVSTYGLVSLIFWYVGLVPDLATMRDRARKKWARITYGIFALGWRGSAEHWHRHQTAYLILAGLATPLVVSVHSVVSLDFASAQLPGWHSTIFPPYFVAGAIYSGFAMVLTLILPVRRAYHLEDMITAKNITNMIRVMLAVGLIVGYGYLMESFSAWYTGNKFERDMTLNRLTGPYAPFYYVLLVCNLIIPQVLWVKKLRQNLIIVFLIALVVNIGMWLERFIIVITSLHRDFLPSSWGMYVPTGWDWSTFIGTIGLFLALLFLFVRFLPIISMTEVRELLHKIKKSDAQPGSGKLASCSFHIAGPISTMFAARVDSNLYGIAGEFESAEKLLIAAERTHAAGYRRIDAFSPFPVEGLHEALGKGKTILPFLVFGAGATGCLGGFFLQYYGSTISYPLNIGGRPLDSWPSYIPITFELTVLCAAVVGVASLFMMNRFPMPYHPVFSIPGFQRVTVDRFFLCIEARDLRFETNQAKQFLKEAGAVRVTEVAR